ncbi:MAG: hypothetical protein IR158_13715 [Cellulomonas sp.]|uniref:hypothetical protein n=1 Tax=Cellulomonas sp. TaxID=40001 RepID=UPI0019F1F2A5|nr:hypothetical protein [Cellulomonas sp.]MBF0688808.1 hypothetical protein [Cellulomonas sp.]
MTERAAQALAEITALRRQRRGVAQTAALEEVVARLEAEGPAEALASAYAGVVESIALRDPFELAFVQFTRAVRWADDHPDLLRDEDVRELLWMHKWMAADLIDLPSSPREQIEQVLRDMERRCAESGRPATSVRLIEYLWDWHAGRPGAEESYERWLASPRDDLADCGCYEAGRRARHLWESGRPVESIAVAEPVVGYRLTCRGQPDDLLATLQLAYLDVGRYDDAARAHHRARAAARAAGTELRSPRHLLFYTRAGHLDDGLALLVRTQEQLVSTRPSVRLGHLQYAAALTANLRLRDPATPVRLDVAPVGDVAELDDWVVAAARELGDRFDARDGTDGQRRFLARCLAIRPVAWRVDLSQPAWAGPAPEPRPAAAGDEAGEPEHVLASRRGDAAVAAGDLDGAAAEYYSAADLARDDGLLVDAGLALARAARCVHLGPDQHEAEEVYDEAVALLRAGGAGFRTLLEVVLAWVPTALAAGRDPAVKDELDRLEREAPGLADRGRPSATIEERAAALRALASDGR